jgi:hypothetical protein
MSAPLICGGWEHESNLVPACKRCNSSKGAKLLMEWRRADRVAHSLKVAAEWAQLAAVVASYVDDEPRLYAVVGVNAGA